jgi:histidinol dehydrogenase
MKKILYPDGMKKQAIVKRPTKPAMELGDAVREIFSSIQKDGDKALIKYTRDFDNVTLESIEVRRETIAESGNRVSQELKSAIARATANIRMFHERQKERSVIVETDKGVACWRESRPIERVGIYVPGGSAPLFSTTLMLAVPATIAGCGEIILCTPPSVRGVHPAILFAANFVGVDRIFSVGGIQAIGAMTYGTETIPKVDKIFGPGNQYVTAAKQIAQMSGNVAIDMPAGPSEVLIIADRGCNPVFVAADLLSQAEHGADSQVILLSDDEGVVDCVISEIEIQLERLPRRDIARSSLENSRLVVLNTIDECVDLSNAYAPEHLILACENARCIATQVVNAGSVFIGNYSCESVGDYASGTNHTLPTNGYARCYSGVSLDSFVKKITFQEISAEGLVNIGPAVEVMAEAELLEAHKNAVSVRLKDLSFKRYQ